MVNQIVYLFGCLKVVGMYNYFTFTSYFVLEDLVPTNYIELYFLVSLKLFLATER